MFERFDDCARRVMVIADEEARRFKHEFIGTEHILLGMMKEGEGVGAAVLKNLGRIDFEEVIKETEQLIKCGADKIADGRLPGTPRARKIVEYALEEARAMKDTYIGTEHLLVGLLRETDGVAGQVLVNLGLNVEDVKSEVLKLRESI